LKWLAAIALIVAALDLVLMNSGYMLLAHKHEIRAGETIKTTKFGEVGGDGAVVCTYWTGRSLRKFLDAPEGCRLLSKPTGIWTGQ
jgi:hypothetical protein